MIRIGIRCDAGPDVGAGHLVRCMALAEELLAQGAAVAFFGDLAGVPWAHEELRELRVPVYPGPTTPEGMTSASARHRLDGWVLDSYTLDPSCAGKLRADGRTVLAIVDTDTRGQEADLYLDQNFGAERATPAIAADAERLAGVEYALLRRSVLDRRPTAPRYAHLTTRVRVLAFFGGTDAFGAAPILTRLLVATGAAADIMVVAANADLRESLRAVKPAAQQTIAVIDPTPQLPRMIARADLVVSAAGTSTWEILCLGAAAALVCVVDNQRVGYRRVVESGLVAGLGMLDEIETSPHPVRVLRGLLTDSARADRLRAAAWSAVDGDGRKRVADRFIDAIHKRSTT